jgi:hypothetical protein
MREEDAEAHVDFAGPIGEHVLQTDRIVQQAMVFGMMNSSLRSDVQVEPPLAISLLVSLIYQRNDRVDFALLIIS